MLRTILTALAALVFVLTGVGASLWMATPASEESAEVAIAEAEGTEVVIEPLTAPLVREGWPVSYAVVNFNATIQPPVTEANVHLVLGDAFNRFIFDHKDFDLARPDLAVLEAEVLETANRLSDAPAIRSLETKRFRVMPR